MCHTRHATGDQPVEILLGHVIKRVRVVERQVELIRPKHINLLLEPVVLRRCGELLFIKTASEQCARNAQHKQQTLLWKQRPNECTGISFMSASTHSLRRLLGPQLLITTTAKASSVCHRCRQSKHKILRHHIYTETKECRNSNRKQCGHACDSYLVYGSLHEVVLCPGRIRDRHVGIKAVRHRQVKLRHELGICSTCKEITTTQSTNMNCDFKQ